MERSPAQMAFFKDVSSAYAETLRDIEATLADFGAPSELIDSHKKVASVIAANGLQEEYLRCVSDLLITGIFSTLTIIDNATHAAEAHTFALVDEHGEELAPALHEELFDYIDADARQACDPVDY